jgi:hypothetical protein
MKNCTSCKITKPLVDFGKRKASKDGMDVYCRNCRQIYYKSKNYDRKEYQSSYKRVITEERKKYLKEYNINNQHKYYTPKIKSSNCINSIIEIKRINKLVHRTLLYKNEEKLKLSKDYLGWTKLDFINKFGRIPKDYHIDHKIPVSWFIKNAPIEIINNLNNLQLLPKSENLKKNNKFCHPISIDFLNECREYIDEYYLDKISIV